MQRILFPFRALVARPDLAPRIACPPYDTVDVEGARRIIEEEPLSFMRVVRPEAVLPAGTKADAPAAYEEARRSYQRLIDDGALVDEPGEAFFVCRMTEPGGHRQVGVIAVAAVEAYRGGRILRHELTRPHRVKDRARHIEALSAHTEPVLVACPGPGGIEAALDRLVAAPPAATVTDRDGVRHELWVAPSHEARDLDDALASTGTMVIADGHHRAEGSALAAERLGSAEAARFLVFVVPAGRLRILGYHRAVRDLAGNEPETFVARLREKGAVERCAPRLPARRGEISVYVAGEWHCFRPEPRAAGTSASERLDVSVLQREVLDPLLGVSDPTRDPRVSFVPGSVSIDGLRDLVDRGGHAIVFACFPVGVDEVIGVASAGEVMPPKSTWFSPKVRSGLVVHPIRR